jgi:two-component system OmpR family sensor kinase
MNRLWVQLTLAFAVVILVTAGTVGVLANLRAGEAFRLYLSYSPGDLYEPLLEGLSAYFQMHGTWEGVESLLQVMPLRREPMMGRRRSFTFPEERSPQVVLADHKGLVLYDRLGPDLVRRLTRDEEAAALDILVAGNVVGRLVIAWPMESAILGPLEQRFVARLRQLLAIGAALAGGLGLVLGLALTRSLTAPLQRLSGAARALAAGDLAQRVEVTGSADVADVAQAFNEMAEGLEEAERLRHNLIVDVAHELRTPLSVLQGNLQAILDDVYPLDRAEITRLYDETRLLSRLVDDLRELALADAGELRLNLQPTDAGRVVQATAESLSPAAQAQGVALTAEVRGILPLIQADPDRLAQVLRNLLVNALRHTPSGQSVTVTASPVTGAVEFAVVDTGEGIAAKDLPHMFERLWRADRSRTRDEHWAGGSGLGLSIAKSLVEAQGGRIWVESKPGEGATFRFTIPSVQQE